MCDEYTRNNRINKAKLKIQLIAVYLTSISIIIGLFTYVSQEAVVYTQFPYEKGIIQLVLLICFIGLIWEYRKDSSEIDEIFSDSPSSNQALSQTYIGTQKKTITQNKVIIYLIVVLFCSFFLYYFTAIIESNDILTSITTLDKPRMAETIFAIFGGISGAICYAALGYAAQEKEHE